MYYREAFDKNSRHGFANPGSGCRENFRSRLGEAFAGGFRGAPWAHGMKKNMAAFKPVNITDETDRFVLSLYAAGLKKEEFGISIDDDILTISYQPAQEEKQESFVYEEFRPSHFSRSFQLNGKVLTQEISAEYTDGVLRVILPKNPETQHHAQEIKIS
ncbi:MAG: hypothetical protein ABS46_09625 [Cytophagaceae bacterium SCN 52-12]|nr:MAG: hypothetical protein ABS46_09625 [Cytophagaceae bacterium SCN 52-12]